MHTALKSKIILTQNKSMIYIKKINIFAYDVLRQTREGLNEEEYPQNQQEEAAAKLCAEERQAVREKSVY